MQPSPGTIIDSKLPPDVPLGGFVDGKADFFTDGREGVDRWGRERKTLTACGTGWGEDAYVCPAYAEEACPGDKSPNVRFAANRNLTCELGCGTCGGGGRSFTISYCGWEKGAGPFSAAVREMGGSLRLDQYSTTPDTSVVPPWDTPLIPSLEWGAKSWVAVMDADFGGPQPWLSTSLRTASPGKTRGGQPLRERLGGHAGKILVNGLIKDDTLDDIWDQRHRVQRWCREQEVDLMCTPQFSYYSSDQLCITLYNTNRIFRWYVECRELGFPLVALDWPPLSKPWLREELHAFVDRNEVKILALSYQLMAGRGGLAAPYIAELRRLHKVMPADISFIVFGLTTANGFAQVAMSLPGRNLTFVTSDPFARASYFKLVPKGDSAPKRFTKADAFVYNVRYERRLAERALAAGARKGARI